MAYLHHPCAGCCGLCRSPYTRGTTRRTGHSAADRDAHAHHRGYGNAGAAYSYTNGSAAHAYPTAAYTHAYQDAYAGATQTFAYTTVPRDTGTRLRQGMGGERGR